MNRTLWQRIRFSWKMFWMKFTTLGISGCRRYYIGAYKHLRITIIIKNTSEVDYGYPREQLFDMLKAIRRCERIQNWKVPEPNEEEIEGRDY